MSDPGIVRNRLKIESTIANAQALLRVRDEFGSFDRYVWQFVGGSPLRRARRSLRDVPAFMQACGLADDHLSSCFRSRGGDRIPPRRGTGSTGAQLTRGRSVREA